MKNFDKFRKALLKSKIIAVFCHINPDGDTLGSLLSLGLGLERLGKKVYFVSPDGVPKIYRVLPRASRIQKSLKLKVDLSIAVDCGAKNLLGKSYPAFKAAKETVEIDHHKTRRSFARISLVDKKAAAVGEIIYTLLGRLGVPLDKQIAQNILTSIIVETNSFRLPTVRDFTFAVCSDLMKTGVNFFKISDAVYWSRTKSSLLLSAICMLRTKFLKKGRVAWSMVRKKDFKSTYGNDEDLDAFANDILSIKKVEAVVFFREKSHKTLRVSLRSKGRHNVARIAEKFGGGGHSDMAGCLIPNSSESVNKVLSQIKKLFN